MRTVNRWRTAIDFTALRISVSKRVFQRLHRVSSFLYSTSFWSCCLLEGSVYGICRAGKNLNGWDICGGFRASEDSVAKWTFYGAGRMFCPPLLQFKFCVVPNLNLWLWTASVVVGLSFSLHQGQLFFKTIDPFTTTLIGTFLIATLQTL